MIRYFLSLLAAVSLMPAMAQTDFRHITYDEALQAAKSEGKLVFIDFYTQWCGPCKRMASKVFPSQEVGDYMNANFVCIKIDAEAEEGTALAKQFEVKAYPTFVVVTPEGKATGSFAGYKEGSDFIAKIETCRNPDLTPERVAERYEGGERTPEVVNAYASNLIDASNNYMEGIKEGVAVVDEYYDSLTDSQRLDPANHFMYAAFTYDYSNPRLKFMIENRDRFDASKREEIGKIIERLFKGEAVRYFTSSAVTTDEGRADYAQFKQASADLGYSSLYDNMLRFIDKHAELDTDSFITWCDDNCDSLSLDDLGTMLYYLPSIFEPKTPEQTTRVSSIARKRLINLPATQLYWTVNAIMQLENPKH